MALSNAAVAANPSNPNLSAAAVADPAHALVSSSLVRQVAALGGDVSPFVPGAVARFLDTGSRGR